MTVAELIDILSAFDDDAEVLISHVASDYLRTQVANPVSSVSPQVVVHSAYHETWTVQEDQEADHEDESKEAVVIE